MIRCYAFAIIFLSAMGNAWTAPYWDLVWSDEFDVPGSPDPTKWRIQVGPSMVNNEPQYYSDRQANLKVEDGTLKIIARKESFGGREYTSGRLDTETKAFWTYGRFEIRAKLPKGKGTWPAFWMLSHDCAKFGGWPDCGEIDIMEYAGKNPNQVNTTVHMRDINYRLKNNPHGGALLEDVANVYHVFALDWYKDRMDFWFDGVKVMTFKDAGKGFGSWPYFNPQYIILNQALGGGYGGPIDNAIFPATFTIDYVRVYKEGLPTPLIRRKDAGSASPAVRALEDAIRYQADGRTLPALTAERPAAIPLPAR